MGKFDFEALGDKPGYSLGDVQSVYSRRLARRQLTYPAASMLLSAPAGVLGYLVGKKFGHGTAGAALGAASVPLLAWLLAKGVNLMDSEKPEDKFVWLTSPAGQRFKFSIRPGTTSDALVATEDMKKGIPSLVGLDAPARLRGSNLFNLSFNDDNTPALKARKNLGATALLMAMLQAREDNLTPMLGFGEEGDFADLHSLGYL